MVYIFSWNRVTQLFISTITYGEKTWWFVLCFCNYSTLLYFIIIVRVMHLHKFLLPVIIIIHRLVQVFFSFREAWLFQNWNSWLKLRLVGSAVFLRIIYVGFQIIKSEQSKTFVLFLTNTYNHLISLLHLVSIRCMVWDDPLIFENLPDIKPL